MPQFVPTTFCEASRYRTERQANGIALKILKIHTSMLSFMDFPVKSREDG